MNVLVSIIAFGISFTVLLFFVDFVCQIFIGISPLDYMIDSIIHKMTNEIDYDEDEEK